MVTSRKQNRKVYFDEAGAAKMDRTAVEIFAPVYPVLAAQIVRNLGITKGNCVDMGSGSGLLSLALARITQLRMILLDAAMPMHMRAKKHLSASGKKRRFTLLCGDVHNIPLNDASIHLMVSRGSIFFWDHPELAFKEIHRVLAPSGRSYMGGGFGSAELGEHIRKKMAVIQPEWRAFRDRNLGEPTRQKFITALHAADIDYDIIRDDSGFWIIIKKE